MRKQDLARTGLGAKLASFVAGLDIETVPRGVREEAKLHVLDAIGCGIAGAASEPAVQALRFAALEHAPGACVVLATGSAFGPATAAFANAAAMNALDFDDGLEVEGRGMGHPGATLVAAAISAVWQAPVGGVAFLAAIVAAYEVNNRLIMSMQPSMARFRQVYGVCQHQTVGAAAAYGRLVGLDAASMENAFGLAATLANVPSLRKYNFERRPLVTLKDLNAPAARTGVEAVQLHQAGFVGAAGVFEGPSGYWRMAGSDRFSPGALIAGLGERWTLPLNSFKPYPACRWMHCALEGFERIRDSHGLDPAEIKAVTLHTSEGMAADFFDYEPSSIIDAQFSLPYGISALAHRVPLSFWYRDEAMVDARMKATASRVHAKVDAKVDAMMRETRVPAGRVSVRARGRTYSSGLIRQPLGGGSRPLPAERVIAKFEANAAPAIGARRAARLARAIMALEEAPDVAALLAELRPAGRRQLKRLS